MTGGDRQLIRNWVSLAQEALEQAREFVEVLGGLIEQAMT